MNNNGILVIDLELTCWDKKDPDNSTGIREIIQIGIVDLDPQTLEIKKKQSYFVKPQFNDELSQYCKDLTAITHNQVFKEGKPLKEVMNTLSKNWGFSNKLIVFWGDDHLDFERDCNRLNLENKTSKSTINFGLQYAVYQSMKNKSTLQNVGLIKAMNNENLDFIGRQHDGLVDAENTAILYKTFHEKFL